jgi:D-alanyl-D-alanine carboxypeptidase (penicillin-binding protein 5/6)
MKKFFAVILALAIALTVFPATAFGASEAPEVTAEAALVADLTTGEILYEKNADERLYPASLTKMLTGILAIENVSLGITMTADDEIETVEPTILKMKAGEQITARDALYCMLIASCNDLAELFAKHMSGSVAEFAKLMNEKAAEIGCENSHFVNPHGLHDEDHYTTARDLYKIVSYCMQNELFREIVGMTEYTYTRGKGALNPGKTETVKTTNWLLYNTTTAIFVGPDKRTPKYDGCIGIKTGYDDEAKGCMIAAAEKDGTTILTIVLRSDGDTSGIYERVVDSIKLLQWGQENFRTYKAASAGQDFGKVKVKRGAVKNVGVALNKDIYTTLDASEAPDTVSYEAVIPDSVHAPVNRGDVIGKVKLSVGGEPRGEYDLVATSTVEKGGPLSIFGIDDATAAKIFALLGSLVMIVVAFAAMYVVYRKVRSDRAKARKKSADNGGRD